MTYTNLLVEPGAVALVTVNRPKALNARDMTTVRELGQVVRELDADRAVRAVILTGAGEKAFVAGADIAAMAGLGAAEATAFSTEGQAVFAVTHSPHSTP